MKTESLKFGQRLVGKVTHCPLSIVHCSLKIAH